MLIPFFPINSPPPPPHLNWAINVFKLEVSYFV